MTKKALELVAENARLKAEIERLKKENTFHRKTIAENAQIEIEVLNEAVMEAISKARKEFAERLKKEYENLEFVPKTTRKRVSVDELKDMVSWVIHEVFPQSIDKLLKEMESSDNG